LTLHYFGDTLYGKASPLIARQALHSSKIQCVHPISKKQLTFACPLPDDMQMILGTEEKIMIE